jgi:MerR HTH family regulatory protein
MASDSTLWTNGRGSSACHPSTTVGRSHLPVVRLTAVTAVSGARPAMAIGPSEEWPAETIPDLLSSTDVEQIFARSARTLHRWERRGHLTPVRVGHAKFYRAEDIRRLVSGQLEAAMGTQAGAQTGTGQAARTGKTRGTKMP